MTRPVFGKHWSRQRLGGDGEVAGRGESTIHRSFELSDRRPGGDSEDRQGKASMSLGLDHKLRYLLLIFTHVLLLSE